MGGEQSIQKPETVYLYSPERGFAVSNGQTIAFDKNKPQSHCAPFILNKEGQNKVSLRSADTNKYLCVEPDGKIIINRDVVNVWETLTTVQDQDGKFKLKSHHSTFLNKNSASFDNNSQDLFMFIPYSSETVKNSNCTNKSTVNLKDEATGKYLKLRDDGVLTFSDTPTTFLTHMNTDSLRNGTILNMSHPVTNNFVSSNYQEAICKHPHMFEWETFNVEMDQNQLIRIRSHFGTYLHCDSNTNAIFSNTHKSNLRVIVVQSNQSLKTINASTTLDVCVIHDHKLVVFDNDSCHLTKGTLQGSNHVITFHLDSNYRINRTVSISNAQGRYINVLKDGTIQTSPSEYTPFQIHWSGDHNQGDEFPKFVTIRTTIHEASYYMKFNSNGKIYFSPNKPGDYNLLILNHETRIESDVYRLNGMLGNGYWGEVMSAECNGQQRAVKYLYRSIERAKIEATAAKRVGSGECVYLPRVYGAAIDKKDHVFISMELISGDTYQEYTLKESNPKTLPEQKCIELYTMIVTALAHMHKHNVLYLDIAEYNMMYDGNRVMLIDFGSALILNGGDRFVNANYMIGGTAAYMPWEQHGGEITVSRATDVYSSAAFFFFMLTGASPFGPVHSDFFKVHKVGIPEHFFGLVKNERVRNVLRKCLKVNVDERYRSCDQVLHDLKN
ncbi:serine/threonine protein kinase [Acrasis kona]|uniref:Serine/threonine protein kinase n=1 Tax=Acrasis kona TaxID=1008807 RepID=A0AAW2YVI3_9EUKA